MYYSISIKTFQGLRSKIGTGSNILLHWEIGFELLGLGKNCHWGNVIIKCTCILSNLTISLNYGYLGFFASAATFNHSRIVEILLESGADPEAKDELEMTPLLMAVTRGAVETAKLLLDRGVDITANDSSLNSALHLAIVYGRPEMVKLLLEMDKDGVLVRMRDKDMKTITHLAAGLDTSKVLLPFVRKYSVIEFFVLRGSIVITKVITLQRSLSSY